MRLLLDRARSSACGWPYQRFLFQDGLALPIPAHVPTCDKEFIKARRIFEMNARRLGRGRGADQIGARIDAARISALTHDFRAALTQVELAAASRFASGTSIEVLLELLAVRTRICVDATIVSLIAQEDQERVVDPDVVSKLADFLNIERNKPETNIRVVEALVGRTRESGETFYRYAGTWGPHHPYYTFGTYMMGWVNIVASRLPASREVQLKYLREALRLIEGARRHMYESEYCMHFFEAGCVSRALRRATGCDASWAEDCD
jgi:hypothetical protein